MRIRSIIIGTGLFLGAACNRSDPVNTVNPTPDPQNTASVSVMSFNALVTHPSDKGDQLWSLRGPACVAMILDVQPDIVGLQECRQAQFEYLTAALSEEYEGVNIPESKTNFGTCILYRKERFSRVGSGYRWFSSTPDVPSPAYPDICDDPTYRTFIWAHLRLRGTTKALRLYSTHFPRPYEQDNAQARNQCAQAIVDHAKKECSDDVTVFVTGDMNCALSTEQGRYCLQPFSSWMTSARGTLPDSKRDNWYSMNSFKDEAPIAGGERSIDHIFCRGAQPLSYCTVVDEYGEVRFSSDHYPILCDMQITY